MAACECPLMSVRFPVLDALKPTFRYGHELPSNAREANVRFGSKTDISDGARARPSCSTSSLARSGDWKLLLRR